MSGIELPGTPQLHSTLRPADAGEAMDGPRLVLCYDCGTLTKVAPPPAWGEDADLMRVVEAHQHTDRGPHDVHMQMFPTSWKTWERLDVETEFRKTALENQIWISEYRDQVGEDAVRCHRQHNQPEFPSKPCIDYKSESKRLGGGLSVRVDPRRRDPKKLQYLCTYCPYESTVTTAKRWDKGAYKQ